MSDQETTPGSSGDEPDGEPDRQDDAAEAALIRKVIREQERHREGGVDPELAEADPELEIDRDGFSRIVGSIKFALRKVKRFLHLSVARHG